MLVINYYPKPSTQKIRLSKILCLFGIVPFGILKYDYHHLDVCKNCYSTLERTDGEKHTFALPYNSRPELIA